MRSFKNGDLVICINNTNQAEFIEVNKTYEIANYNDISTTVKLKYMEIYSFNSNRFVLSPIYRSQTIDEILK